MRFVTGDVAKVPPMPEGFVFIPHIANDVGRWGAGFTKSLDARWPEAHRDYLDLCKEEGRIPRGSMSFTEVAVGWIIGLEALPVKPPIVRNR